STPGGSDVLTVRKNFLTFEPTFRGGARVALGDVNGDNVADLAVAAGFLGGPRVTIFSGVGLLAASGDPTTLANFFIFPGTDAVNRTGAFVALGDVDRDGFADVIGGGGPGGAPRVFVLSGKQITTAVAPGGNFNNVYSNAVGNFFVQGNSSDRGGVRVAVKDSNRDGRADVVTGSGEGSPALVRVYLGTGFPSPNGIEPTGTSLSVFGSVSLPGGV